MRFISYRARTGEGVGLRTAEGHRGLPVAKLDGDLKNPYHNAGFGYAMGPGAGSKGTPITLVFRKAKP